MSETVLPTPELIVSAVGVSRTINAHGSSVNLLVPTTVHLHTGTLVALAGPSGSGKTTLCNIIIGWEPSDTGSVQWFDDEARSWARLAVAPQCLALLPSLDLRENLVLPFWSTRRDVPATELDDLAVRLEIDGLLGRHPAQVSFGEQQRAGIARALLGTPRLAVLDEPTGHQDEARAALVVETLLAARARGTCVFVATHDADVIAAADEVIQLESPLAASHAPS